MTAEQVATILSNLLEREGLDGLEQVVSDSDTLRQFYIEVRGEWFTVDVHKDAL